MTIDASISAADAAETPVLVIGAGPTGQTAALLLARWGLPVVVVDARPERDPIGSKALVQQRDVIDVWCAVGVGDQIADEGVTWRTARTFYKDQELFAVEWVDNGASPIPAFVNISQARTEELLDGAIARQPLIEVRWGHEVIGYEQDSEGVSLICATAHGTVSVRGSHVVACGGSKGDRLRELLDVSFEGHAFSDRFLICDVRTDLGEWAEERRFYFDPAWNPGRQVLVHPCPDSVFRIDWQVPPDYDVEAEDETGEFDARIRKIVGDADYDIVWRSVYRFQARVASRFRVGKILLAGDLAHVVSPFGARGLNSGVQDVDNAAWKIACVRRGWGDEEALLESYHAERLDAALENVAISSATTSFLIPQDEAEMEHRLDILKRALADSSVHPQVDSGRLAEPYWYPESPLVSHDDTRPIPSRPRKGEYPIPAPGVILPDFPVRVPGADSVRRIREIVRRGFTVLVTSPSDEAAGIASVEQVLADKDVPVDVVSLPEVDPSGLGRGAMGARDGELWLIRPDAHVAAVARSARELAEGLDRTLGRTLSRSV